MGAQFLREMLTTQYPKCQNAKCQMLIAKCYLQNAKWYFLSHIKLACNAGFGREIVISSS